MKPFTNRRLAAAFVLPLLFCGVQVWAQGDEARVCVRAYVETAAGPSSLAGVEFLIATGDIKTRVSGQTDLNGEYSSYRDWWQRPIIVTLRRWDRSYIPMAESVEADWSNGCFRAEFHFAPVELQLPPDRDRDGIPDTSDNCIDVPNTDQADADGDRLGDACDPNPRIPEEIPESPEEVPERPDDADGDGVPDSEDNCVRDANPLQTDSDGDGRGDACDPRPRQPDPEKPDTDNDGIPDDEDNCPRNPNPRQSDFDRDRLGDACDPNPRIPEEFPERPDDADDDGVPDSEDNCVRDANPLQTDSDGDGRGDACDSVTPWFRIIGGIVLLGLGGFGLYWSYRVRKPPVALSSTSPTAPGIPVWTRYSARMEPRGWWREGIDRMGEPAPTDPEAPGIKFEISFAAQPDAGEGRLETSGLLIVEEREINDDNIT